MQSSVRVLENVFIVEGLEAAEHETGDLEHIPLLNPTLKVCVNACFAEQVTAFKIGEISRALTANFTLCVALSALSKNI